MEGPKSKQLLIHLKQDRRSSDLLELAIVILKFQFAVTLIQTSLERENAPAMSHFGLYFLLLLFKSAAYIAAYRRLGRAECTVPV